LDIIEKLSNTTDNYENIFEHIKYYVEYLNISLNKNDNHNEWIPLILAIECSNIKLIEYFISKGADVNYCNYEGESPLIIAENFNNQEIITKLISNGAK
jgi:ankyrin repeat protein